MRRPRQALSSSLFALVLAGCTVTTSSTTTPEGENTAKPDAAVEEAPVETPSVETPSDEASPNPGEEASQPDTPAPDGPGDRIKASPDAMCPDGAHKVGEQYKIECNTCSCNAAGDVMCTRMACNVPAQ